MEPTEQMDNICEDIKTLFINQNEDSNNKQNDLNAEETNGTLAVKVMTVIYDALAKDIDEEITSIHDLKSKDVDLVVKDITSKIVSSPSMVCIQENINNIIETCTQELITEYPTQNVCILSEMQQFGNHEMVNQKIHSKTVSPILQPFQYVELAHNITAQKPSFIRVQAFEVLNSSQLTDAVSSVHWPVLQKSLQSSLMDDHYDIFHLCIRVHAKLIARSSPDGLKESFLNILESLCQHYYTHKLDCNEISSQIPAHYRVIRLTQLMLDCIKEIAQSLPRLGEKHLVEMIDNFMHLICIHSSSRSQTEYSGFNILDVVSCLDPNANWFKYISYNAVCRRIMFLKMSQNYCLLRIIISEILEWFNQPIFADSDPRSGNLNKTCCKFAKFIHCLSLVSRICTYETGKNLFPISLSKEEEPIKIQRITLIVLKFLNRQRLVEEKMEIIFSDLFIKFLINSFEDLVCVKDTTSNYTLSNILHVLFEPLSEKPELPPQHTVSIIESLCTLPDGPQNYFFRYGGLNKRRNLLFNSDNSSSDEQHNVTSSPSNFTVGSVANMTVNDHRHVKESSKINNIEKQILSMKSAIDSFAYYSFCPVKIVTNVVVVLLTTRQLRDMTVTAKLVNVCCKLFQLHEGITILESNKSLLIHHAATVYQELIDIINNDGYKVLEERNFYLLFSSIENFIIVTGTTPLGFHLLVREQRMVTDCIGQQLNQLPTIGWQQPKWRLFVTFAAFNSDCANVFHKERDVIFKDVLGNLWSVLETSFETDSSILLDEAINYFMIVVATVSISLKAVNAIFQSTDENGVDDEIDKKSDETITEPTTFEVYPVALASLILAHALNNHTFNYKVHEIGLSALNVLISTNIDNMLWLQNRLQFQEKLLLLQSENRVLDGDEGEDGSTSYNDNVIVDECSLLRHEILEKISSVGPLGNNDNNNFNETKMYFTPPPLSSLPSRAKLRPRTYMELGKFLQDTRNGLHDVNWLRQARKAYRAGGNDEIKCTLLLDLVEQVQRALSNSLSTDPTEGLKWVPNKSAENVELFPEDYIGIQLVIRYGVQHKLIQTHAATQASDNLALIVKLARLSLFGEENLPQEFIGFDWFLSTVYLVCSGNVEKCQTMITSLTTLPSIAHVWDQYSISIGHATAGVGHTVETIVKAELPQLFHALVTNGISWWTLCCQWIRECFLRLLEWNQVCHWLAFAVLHPPEYIVYFCVSILHHAEQRVLDDANNATLWKLLINPPEKFSVFEYLPYMDKLWKRHHGNVLVSLETLQ